MQESHIAYSKFQFLIGTLKTQRAASHPRRQGEFQFLIGTLKTGGGEMENMLMWLFQFLIGTLKTPCSYYLPVVKQCVSIPHRYAKNAASALPAPVFTRGFNSS